MVEIGTDDGELGKSHSMVDAEAGVGQCSAVPHIQYGATTQYKLIIGHSKKKKNDRVM